MSAGRETTSEVFRYEKSLDRTKLLSYVGTTYG